VRRELVAAVATTAIAERKKIEGERGRVNLGGSEGEDEDAVSPLLWGGKRKRKITGPSKKGRKREILSFHLFVEKKEGKDSPPLFTFLHQREKERVLTSREGEEKQILLFMFLFRRKKEERGVNTILWSGKREQGSLEG